MTMAKSISRRIRHFRALRGLTQAELANRAGINFRHYQKIEGGHVRIKPDTISKIAHALEVPDLLLLDHIPHACQDTKERRCCLECGILDQLPVGISIVDHTGLFIYSNRAHGLLCGRSPSEVDGKYHCWDFAPTAEAKTQAKNYFHYFVTNKTKPVPYRGENLTPNGQIQKVLITWRFLNGHRGENVFILSVVQELI